MARSRSPRPSNAVASLAHIPPARPITSRQLAWQARTVAGRCVPDIHTRSHCHIMTPSSPATIDGISSTCSPTARQGSGADVSQRVIHTVKPA